MEDLLKVVDLKKSYKCKKSFFKKDTYEEILKGINLEVKSGQIVGLLGESGCGKSTLSKIIVKLIESDCGEIYFNGVDISKMSEEEFHPFRKDIQYISQNPFTSFNPKMKVCKIMTEAMEEFNIGNKETRQDIILELLEDCGLPKDSLNRYPHEFSGGQLQRLAIARALTLNPKLILADEIVSALDISIQAQILDLLMELKDKKNLSILFISHDLGVIRKISNKIYVMEKGKIVDVGTSKYIFEESNVEYTRKLVEALPIFNY